MAVLSGIFTFAEKQGTRPLRSNPCYLVDKNAEDKRETLLSRDEITRLGDTLTKYEDRNTEAKEKGEDSVAHPSALLAIRLLLLTGARKSEIVQAKWDWVDLVTGQLRLPDSKTGRKSVPLPPPALKLLNKQIELAESLLDDDQELKRNPYIISGKIEGKHLIGLQKIWERIRKQADLEHVRLHDLRHAWASIAAQSGESLYLIGKVLGHTDQQTTQRYAHVDQTHQQAVSNRTAETLQAALDGRDSAEIHQFHKKGGA
jgi:integrase